MQTYSYANQHNQPWESKEISVYGAAMSFIKQVKMGDLTHVSLPSLFMLPYSILEFIAIRMSSVFEALLPLGQIEDPRKRLEGVLAFLIGMGRQEDLMLNHKPFNPVLGEIHQARIDHDDGSYSYVICEQTVHHPPTSAFELHNPHHGVTLCGNMNFGVTLHSNSVTVKTCGGLKVVLTLADGSEEIYLLEEGVPDMLLRNVIIGTKYVYWTGSLHVYCPTTGHHAQMAFTYKDSENRVNGVMWNDVTSAENSPKSSKWGKFFKSTAKYTTGWFTSDEDDWMETLEEKKFAMNQIDARFRGVCGQECFVYPKTDGEFSPEKRYVLVNPQELPVNECDQYPSSEFLPSNSSISIWRQVGEAIIADDLEAADDRKSKIEIEQRILRANRTEPFVPQYFTLDETHGWPFWEVLNREWFLNDPSQIYKKSDC